MGKAFIKMAFVILTIFDCQLSFDKSTSSVYVMYKCIQVLLDNILSKFCLFLPPSSYPSIRGGQGIFTTGRFVDERAPHDFVLVLSEFCHNKNKTKQRQMTNCIQFVDNLSFVFVLSCFCIQFVICLYFVLFLLWQNSDKTQTKPRKNWDKL